MVTSKAELSFVLSFLYHYDRIWMTVTNFANKVNIDLNVKYNGNTGVHTCKLLAIKLKSRVQRKGKKLLTASQDGQVYL